ncbi:MAG: phage minor head protein [Moraxella sp.]
MNTSTDILPNQKSIIHFQGKTLLTSNSYAEVKAYQHALAFTAAKMMDMDLLLETKEAIGSALKNGTDFNDFKKHLLPFLISKGWLGLKDIDKKDDKTNYKIQDNFISWRLRTIYHTNMQTAYSAGQWQRVQETKEFLPYLKYMPSISTHRREEHKRYYGIIRPVDDPVWQSLFPPNGYGCKCWVKSLTKKEAQREGIDNSKIETEIVKNPATQEEIEVPKGVHFSFIHNHDRLSALFKLAEDKHSNAFGEKLKLQLTDLMIKMSEDKGILTANFIGIAARQKEIDRLKIEIDNTESLSEGIIADEWQQYYNVELERYNPNIHKIIEKGKPADFAMIEKDKPPIEWLTLDFMFSMVKDDIKSIDNMNYMLSNHKRKSHNWKSLKNNIIKHIDKSDIVPLDLRYFSIENRTKIIAYVLSLSKEQQAKIVLIWGE